MIGLVASILVGVALQNYPPFLLAAIPYLLRVKSRNLSLMAFYGYVILLALTLPGGVHIQLGRHQNGALRLHFNLPSSRRRSKGC